MLEVGSFKVNYQCHFLAYDERVVAVKYRYIPDKQQMVNVQFVICKRSQPGSPTKSDSIPIHLRVDKILATRQKNLKQITHQH